MAYFTRDLALILAGYYLRRKPTPWLDRQEKRQAIIQNLIECEDISNIMDVNTFNKILKLIEPHLEASKILNEFVRAEDCLVATLLYLITGCEYQSLKDRTLICTQQLEKMIPTTLSAIFEGMKWYMLPSTEDHWQKVIDTFDKRLQFKNCVGSINAKHISIKKPPEPKRNTFLNPQGKYSSVWFAVVGANYEFLTIGTGYESEVPGGELLRDFYDFNWMEWFDLPESCPLPGTDKTVPCVLVGDSLCPLEKCCMTPYQGEAIMEAERVFNYRLYRATQVVDNAIGVLTSRFRILTSKNLDLDEVHMILMGCCLLHNFLLKYSRSYLKPSDVDREDVVNGRIVPGKWRQNPVQLEPVKKTYIEPSNEGIQLRNTLKEYFNSIGKLDFQEKMMYVAPCIEPLLVAETDCPTTMEAEDV